MNQIETQNLTTDQKIDIILNETLNGGKFLDFLNVIAVVLGFYNSYLNQQQIGNNDIMAELDKQDKIYFNQIITLLNEIKGGKNDNDKQPDEKCCSY
jgi:hypothetical protein